MRRRGGEADEEENKLDEDYEVRAKKDGEERVDLMIRITSSLKEEMVGIEKIGEDGDGCRPANNADVGVADQRAESFLPIARMHFLHM